ncbi:MAG TPA: hypothetical protein VI685_04090, partial [Candidatus Angelobacter sp.]
TSGHMEEVFYSNNAWQVTDLSLNGTAYPVSQIIQLTPGAFYYLDGYGHAYGLYYHGNDVWTGSGNLPGDSVAAGSPFAAYVDSAGITYLMYATTSGHMEVVSYVNNAWQANDLSVANGTAGPVSQIVQTSPGVFYYLDTNGKIVGIFAP